MIEAEDQSQFFINPSIITVQDIEKKLKCPMGNQAFILCTNSQCQKPEGIICRTNGCTCDELHSDCHTVKLKGTLKNLFKYRDIKQSHKVDRQRLNAMIKRLSEVRERIQMQQKYFGLQKCELFFMELIEEQKFEKICGKFTSELVKTFQSKKEIFMRSNKHFVQEFYEAKAKISSLCEQIQNNIMKLAPRPQNVKITPDKQSWGFKENNWVIDNTNSNVCIKNTHGWNNWLCSSALPFDGEFVFTIKALKLTNGIWIGVMEAEKKREKMGGTWKYSVYLDTQEQQISRPNEEQTSWSNIKCQCSKQLPQCPFQIECHVNRQQNTIAWHYGGKQQAKSTLPKAWKTNKKQLCAIVYVSQKGECVQMM